MGTLIPVVIFFVGLVLQYQMIRDKLDYNTEAIKDIANKVEIMENQKLDKEHYEKDRQDMITELKQLNDSVSNIGYYLLDSQTFRNRVKS